MKIVSAQKSYTKDLAPARERVYKQFGLTSQLGAETAQVKSLFPSFTPTFFQQCIGHIQALLKGFVADVTGRW